MRQKHELEKFLELEANKEDDAIKRDEMMKQFKAN